MSTNTSFNCLGGIMKEQYSHVILKMWYWNWGEDESVSKVILLKNDSSLDDCVREIVTEYALLHNRSRPDRFVKCKDNLTIMMQDDIHHLRLSKQHLCEYTRHTMLNVLSYTDIKGDGHIEVMGLFTNAYELLGRAEVKRQLVKEQTLYEFNKSRQVAYGQYIQDESLTYSNAPPNNDSDSYVQNYPNHFIFINKKTGKETKVDK